MITYDAGDGRKRILVFKSAQTNTGDRGDNSTTYRFYDPASKQTVVVKTTRDKSGKQANIVSWE